METTNNTLTLQPSATDTDVEYKRKAETHDEDELPFGSPPAKKRRQSTAARAVLNPAGKIEILGGQIEEFKELKTVHAVFAKAEKEASDNYKQCLKKEEKTLKAFESAEQEKKESYNKFQKHESNITSIQNKIKAREREIAALKALEEEEEMEMEAVREKGMSYSYVHAAETNHVNAKHEREEAEETANKAKEALRPVQEMYESLSTRWQGWTGEEILAENDLEFSHEAIEERQRGELLILRRAFKLFGVRAAQCLDVGNLKKSDQVKDVCTVVSIRVRPESSKVEKRKQSAAAALAHAQATFRCMQDGTWKPPTSAIIALDNADGVNDDIDTDGA